MGSQIRVLLILIIACCCYSFQTSDKFEIFISTTGNDNNPGTIQKPFATPERARNAIRKIKASQPNASFIVYFRGGTYYRYNTFELNELDAGQKDSPVIFKPYQDEQVTFHGGRKVDGYKSYICTDRAILSRMLSEVKNKIWVINLKAQGITDFGELKQHGFGTRVEPSPLELFINGEPQILARYPNQSILKIGRVYDKGSTPCNGDLTNRGAEFGYEYDRPARWLMADDIWLHGKFSYGYNDDNLKIKSIDTAKRSFKVVQPHIYGVFSCYRDSDKDDPAGLSVRGYYAYNLLEEIDQPGEYYLDRETGKLYIYPSSPLADADIDISISQNPFFTITNTSDIKIEKFTFTCTRGLGIYLDNTNNITIDACKFTNFGTAAIVMGQFPKNSNNLGTRPEFTDNVISNCLISNMGTGGVFIEGGDRKTLIPGNNLVYNCEFNRVDRINETYSPAVRLLGVGNIIRNCYIHDMKHLAINFMGNDHLIEYNKIENVCKDADDMGSIYTGRDPSSRGTIIQYNFFSHIEPIEAETSLSGIFVDDGSGGTIIQRNFFYKVGSPGHYQHVGAVFFHGGHDNKVTNNIFFDCKVAVGHGPWDDARWKTFLESTPMQERLCKNVDITSEIYQQKYPELKDYFTNIGRRLNDVQNNLAINGQIARSGDFILRTNIAIYNSSLQFDAIDYKEIKKQLPSIEAFPFEKVGLKIK